MGVPILKGVLWAPRTCSLILTISHSLRTMLTCVRICSTWASSTENSSSFFSVGTVGAQGGGGAGPTR